MLSLSLDTTHKSIRSQFSDVREYDARMGMLLVTGAQQVLKVFRAENSQYLAMLRHIARQREPGQPVLFLESMQQAEGWAYAYSLPDNALAYELVDLFGCFDILLARAVDVNAIAPDTVKERKRAVKESLLELFNIVPLRRSALNWLLDFLTAIFLERAMRDAPGEKLDIVIPRLRGILSAELKLLQGMDKIKTMRAKGGVLW
jgi:hypothetical protein